MINFENSLALRQSKRKVLHSERFLEAIILFELHLSCSRHNPDMETPNSRSRGGGSFVGVSCEHTFVSGVEVGGISHSIVQIPSVARRVQPHSRVGYSRSLQDRLPRREGNIEHLSWCHVNPVMRDILPLERARRVELRLGHRCFISPSVGGYERHPGFSFS